MAGGARLLGRLAARAAAAAAARVDPPGGLRTYTFGAKGTSVGLFYGKFLATIELNREVVDWSRRDVSYLMKQSYDVQFARWLEDAKVVSGIEQAQRGGDAGGDVKILYADKAQLVTLCKRLGLMEDLKAGVPRTAYKGVILLRIGGRRVFLAPSYAVDQDITKRIGR